MTDFEKKDAQANAAFDAFMAERNLVIRNEASRELMFEVWIGGMQFLLNQIGEEMGWTK